MKWRKLGKIFSPCGERDWMRTHAAVPIAEHIGDDYFKIYFSSRDQLNRSHTGYLVIDLNRPTDILEIFDSPVISPCEIGAFDDSGAMATWLAVHNEFKYLYYIGWNLGVTVPFRNAIGLMIDRANGTFARHAQGPIMDRNTTDPYTLASCCVMPGEDCWRMWYVAGTGWWILKGKSEYRCHIQYAESSDGIHWQRDGLVAVDWKDEGEYAISRPCVIKDGDTWKMWYSYRGHRYRIGYAESQDGRSWIRQDEAAGIDVSESGWDSEMIEYPFVFDHKDTRYMLYNGNGYGRTGLGMAVLQRR